MALNFTSYILCKKKASNRTGNNDYRPDDAADIIFSCCEVFQSTDTTDPPVTCEG